MTIREQIQSEAQLQALDPDVVLALVMVESGQNPWAWNPEPKYRYLWNVKTKAPFRAITAAEGAAEFPPVDFPTIGGDRDQEWWGQQASWGLMQVMGAVARERGFKGIYLPELVNPAVNLAIGCAHLASLVAWAKGDVPQALAAFNGGKGGNGARPFRNAEYSEKVMKTKLRISRTPTGGHA